MNTCDEDIEADDKRSSQKKASGNCMNTSGSWQIKGQNLLRVDKFLVARLESSSRLIGCNRAAEAGCILVNGKAVKSNYRVKAARWSCLSSWI